MILSILAALAAQAAPAPTASAPPALPVPMPAPPVPAAPGPVPPRFLSGPPGVYAEAERNAGHHGTVLVAGMIGLDGHYRDVAVVVSSGAPALDQSALDAARATLFTPARDPWGNPVETRVRMPFRFARYLSTAAAPGAAFRYTCAEFVQDMDWWRSTHPGVAWREHELNKLLGGANAIAQLDALRDPTLARPLLADFNRRWERALATCRRQPDGPMIDQFEAERATLERLAEMERRRAGAAPPR